jgi:hypothetical protein
MAQFNHPNICSLVGVCTLPTTEPTLIVLEYMHLGALHGYLQSPMVYEKLETLTMLRMALDVGCGMQYLAEAGFVVGLSSCFRDPWGGHCIFYFFYFCFFIYFRFGLSIRTRSLV